MKTRICMLAASAAMMSPALCSAAEPDDAEALAKKVANPVASLISVPLQYNYDEHYGSESGHKSFINVQPVVPIALTPEWNLISRTIVPLVFSQDNVIPGSRESGIGDITQSLFFSPRAPTSSGLIWGAGPVFLLPTGTDANLSSRKWGAGPTGVLVKQHGPWTYGALANHIWGVGGVEGRTNVSNTFLQPFVSYTTKDAWTYAVNTESNYDWKGKQWSVPLNFTASKLMKWGIQPVSIGGGLRYWATSPDAGPHNWGVRLVVTFLFPK
jgi:hypothetical protein